jgi:putative flavoprotein involved in K+ transport
MQLHSNTSLGNFPMRIQTGPLNHLVESPPATRVEFYDTIVVGGGQAGLAAGYHLAQKDIDFLILDGNDRIGDSWRKRWDSLTLFTPARYSGLPGLPFPANPLDLPDKNQVADYLERYAEHFDLPVRSGTRVKHLTLDGDRFVLHTDRVTYQANSVIVATGPFQRPRVPVIASQLPRSVQQFHSSEYRNPFQLPPGDVLVVGVGNSGAQIAMELAKSRRVWLAGRESGHLRRRLFGRDLYDWIWPIFTWFDADTTIGRRMKRRTRATDPLIGISPSDIVRSGVTRIGRITEVRDGQPFGEDRAVDPDIVIWCTGFTADYDWIDLPVFNDDGYPRHDRGVVAEAPGLYFLGLRFQHRRTSALIGGVGADAAYIAEVIQKS